MLSALHDHCWRPHLQTWAEAGGQEAEASILEAEAFTVQMLEAEALVTKPKPKPGYL